MTVKQVVDFVANECNKNEVITFGIEKANGVIKPYYTIKFKGVYDLIQGYEDEEVIGFNFQPYYSIWDSITEETKYYKREKKHLYIIYR